MNQTIQQITHRFTNQLPENTEYYQLQELQEWGFPSFLTQRIKIELERNLAESMKVGQTEWADISSERVQTAWQQFVIAIHEEARLPASYANTVIETAVADILEMLTKPRKNIPAVIYGTDQELTYRQLCNRVESIVVYRHFARLLPRYMEKKEFETLPKSRCVAIIKKADQKLTSHYSPLNWAQMLEPFFKLTDGKIDTNFLSLFFEDKDKPWIAHQFDLINSNLNRAEVIEVLSSPDALNLEGYKEGGKYPGMDKRKKSLTPQKQIKEDIEKEKEQTEDIKIEGEAEESQKEQMYEKYRTPEELEEPIDQEEENNLHAIFLENENAETETDEEEPESDYSLNDIFSEEESGNESEEDIEYDNEEEEHEDSEYDHNRKEKVAIEPEVRGGQEKKEEQKLQNDQSTQQHKEEIETTGSEKEEKIESVEQSEEELSSPVKEKVVKIESLALPDEVEKEETPIWMRYMSSNKILGTEQNNEQNTQTEESNKDQKLDNRSEKRAKIDDAGFIDDPLIDLSPKEASEKEVNRLKSLLTTHKQLFVEEIFQGSERAFNNAVEEVAPYDSWRDASNYIRKNIFERNQVDMYSEPAVDFTDRLQTYFLEKTVV